MNEIPVKKNKAYIVEIEDNGFEGEGMAKIDNFAIFIPGTIKGEKCEVLIVKVLSSYAYGKLIRVIKKSEARVEPDCATYKRCGGCDLRHMNYETTLKIKQANVQNLVNRNLSKKLIVNETVGMENPYYYRNKAIFPISQEGNAGIYAKRSHEVICFDECKIQTVLSQSIAKFIALIYEGDIYNSETCKGLLRNIMIREGFATNEVMVVLVQNGEDVKFDVDKLVSKYPQIKSVVINVNTKNTNVILADKNKVIYGESYIKDILGGYKFKISPNSFYQINPVQTKKLYDLAIEKANLNKEDVLADLYCGIGTIGIFASKKVNKVYGIEVVPQAIKNAEENAKLNDINNIEFIEGDVEFAFEELIKKREIKPNALIVDPPRKGLDTATIENILKLKPEKFVYISCNPATLVRDLKLLEDVYEVMEVQPVDFFPYTKHVECVVVLKCCKG